MNNYSAIPEELKAVPQWICWQLEDIGASKPTKIPYDAKTGKLAATDDPGTWTTFEKAVEAFNNSLNTSNPYSGIGFVFSKADNYSFIDLDDTNGDTVAYDRQLRVYKEFDSYSEVSPSGRGLHIIIKGNVPQGRRRSFIEVYSSGRYATMTGNVYNDKPIVEQQQKLMQLWEQMGAGSPATLTYHGNEKEIIKDKDILEMALNAVNGEKFKTLNEGRWQELYQSQSEADFAFIDIIAFYTQNRQQIERIFRSSPLGQRPKANRKDYLAWMINKSFDRMLPPIDLDGFKIALDNKLSEKQLELKIGPVAQLVEPVPHKNLVAGSSPAGTTTSPELPPGLLGELAQFIYAAAPRPVPEIALAAAIGLMAGICGRAYNVSGTGLNQYILLLAKTGMGKEGMAAGIDKLMNAVKMQVPTVNNFIGPSHIASGQALVKYVHKKSQCFVSILGEFGIRLQNMSSPHANSAERMLKQILLEIYNKSGFTDVYRASVYADAEKNTETTTSPAFSILGESTPHAFYSALNEDMITEGLLPRFMLIEYNGKRPDLNASHIAVAPSFGLVDKLASLAANAELIMHGKKVINVHLSPEAQILTDKIDKLATNKINSTNDEVVLNLWNRAHIKVLKLSGLIAIGLNMSDPVVLPEHVDWAMKMVQNDIDAFSAKFEAGEIGTNSFETKQTIELIRIIKDYYKKDQETVLKYQVNKLLYKDKLIPYQYLSMRLLKNAAFKNDLRSGATNALKRVIQNFVDTDKLREVGKNEMATKYGTTQRAFVVSNVSILND